MADNLQNRYKAITYEVEELLKKLKERDDIWIDIGKEKEGEDYSNQKIEENIKEKVEEEVLKRKEAWDIINDIYNKHKKIYDKVKQKITCDVNANNLYKVVGKNVTLQRIHTGVELKRKWETTAKRRRRTSHQRVSL